MGGSVLTQQRGGKRAGAGRKPRPDGQGRSIPKAIRISKDVSDYLGEVGSGIVEDLVRRSKAFRDWVQARNGQ